MTDEAEKAYEAQIEAMARAAWSLNGAEYSMEQIIPWDSMDAKDLRRLRVLRSMRAATDAIGLKPGAVVVDVAAINSLADNMAADLRRDWNAIQADGCDNLKMAINAMIAALPRHPEKEGA